MGVDTLKDRPATEQAHHLLGSLSLLRHVASGRDLLVRSPFEFVAQSAVRRIVDDSRKNQVTLLVDRIPLLKGRQIIPHTQFAQDVIKSFHRTSSAPDTESCKWFARQRGWPDRFLSRRSVSVAAVSPR